MKEEKTFLQIKAQFTEHLELKKLRKTSERYAILEFVYKNVGHFNADELYDSMKQGYRVSLATVYNTIDLLLESKLLVKHPFAGTTAQYEKTFSVVEHHHLVCVVCGKVKEFSDKRITTALKLKKFANFEVSHHAVYIYGLCKKCNIQNKK